MKVDYKQLKQIVERQYANSEMTAAQGGAQSILTGNLWSTTNIMSDQKNIDYLGDLIKKTIRGDEEEIEEDDVYLYRYSKRIQERFMSIHKQLQL